MRVGFSLNILHVTIEVLLSKPDALRKNQVGLKLLQK